MTPFGLRLKEWRRAASLSQRELDKRLSRAPGTVGQIESGAMLPPGKLVCEQLDAALGLPRGTAWPETAPHRLRALDPDLADWHEAQVEAATDLHLTQSEREAVLRCRAIEQRRGVGSLLLALAGLADAADAAGALAQLRGDLDRMQVLPPRWVRGAFAVLHAYVRVLLPPEEAP